MKYAARYIFVVLLFRFDWTEEAILFIKFYAYTHLRKYGVIIQILNNVDQNYSVNRKNTYRWFVIKHECLSNSEIKRLWCPHFNAWTKNEYRWTSQSLLLQFFFAIDKKYNL